MIEHPDSNDTGDSRFAHPPIKEFDEGGIPIRRSFKNRVIVTGCGTLLSGLLALIGCGAALVPGFVGGYKFFGPEKAQVYHINNDNIPDAVVFDGINIPHPMFGIENDDGTVTQYSIKGLENLLSQDLKGDMNHDEILKERLAPYRSAWSKYLQEHNL